VPPSTAPAPRHPARDAIRAVGLAAVLSSTAWPVQPAWSQTVSLAGLSAGKALLVINGAPPRFVGTGESVSGVRVLSVTPDSAVVDVLGDRRTLHLGEGPLAAAPVEHQGAHRIVLVADASGHFTGHLQVNGKTLPFLLDTGATNMVLSEAQAQQIGLSLAGGQATPFRAANGAGTGQAVTINSVHIEDVTAFNVDALVIPSALPYVLLGNSFLTRFSMQRENDRMILEQRY